MRSSLPRTFAATLGLLCLTACATTGNFFDEPITATSTQPLDPTLTYYHAYGDSITAGYTLGSFEQTYVSLVTKYNDLPLNGYAIGGNKSCDVPALQIFPHADSPTLTRKGLYTLLIGTNDTYSTGAHEIPFNLCQQASLAWLGVPAENKVAATTAAVTGTYHLETASGWNAVTTDSPGSTITFTLQHSAAGPVYVWYRLISGNGGTFTVAIDGQITTTATTAPASDALGDQSYPNSLALLRLPAVAAGSHTIVFTQTSAASAGMGIVALGTPFTGAATLRPRVLAGLLPLQLNGQRAQVLATYDADIRANAALLAGDGLDVELFDAAHYMTGTSTDMSDALHPNATGHIEIFKAVEDTIK